MIFDHTHKKKITIVCEVINTNFINYLEFLNFVKKIKENAIAHV